MKNKTMRIGLDFDGVITNCGQLKSNTAYNLYGVTIPPEKFKREFVINEGYLSLKQYRHFQQIIYGTLEIGLLMEPVPGALELIPRLIASNHSVTVITSRTGTELEVAKTWSTEQGLNLDFIGVGYQMSKTAACAGLDIFIDDNLDKLEPLADVVPNCFLFSWGYNTHTETGTTIQRISSWQEFFDKITELSN